MDATQLHWSHGGSVGPFQEGKIRWQNPELFPQAELTHTVLQQDGWGLTTHYFAYPDLFL